MKKHLLMICLVLAVCLTAITGCGGGGGGGGGYIPPASETGSISGKIVINTVAIGTGNIKAAAADTEEVRVYLEQNPEISAVADAQGNFLLENVPAGKVFIIAEHRTPAGLLFRIRSPEINVEAAKTAALPGNLEVKRADKMIAGIVINASTSAFIADVNITAWGRKFTTDAVGSFTIANLPDLDFQLKIEKTGFETRIMTINTGTDLAQGYLIEMTPLAAGQSPVGPTTVKGLVKFNDMPMDGVTVICQQFPEATAVTDAQGKFELKNIPPGQINIVALFTMTEDQPDAIRGKTQTITLAAGQTLDITGTPILIDWANGSYSGFVFEQVTNKELTDVKISVLEKTVFSSSDPTKLGFFSLLRLPSENVTVTFEKGGYETKIVNVNAGSNISEAVYMTPIKFEELDPVIEPEGALRELNTISSRMSKMPLDANNIVLMVDAIVRLPEKAGLRRSDLYMVSNDGYAGSFEIQVEKDGYVGTRAVTASSSPALIMLGVKDKHYLYTYHPTLLKIWHPTDTSFDQYIDENSTAEALVLFDNVLWGLPEAKFKQARTKARQHANFAGLANEVALALRAPNAETLFSDSLMQKSYAIAKAVAEDLNVAPEPLSSSMRFSAEASDKQVLVEDDDKRNTASVNLVNRSYCHYTVEVKKGTVAIPSEYGNYWVLPRSTHTSIVWAWPPERKIQVPVTIGAGEFDFKFTRNTKLSIFDGFMTLAGTVIGTGASTYEELNDAYKVLATTGGGLMDMINKAATANVNSAADARKLADELLFSSGKMGFELLMDFAPKYFGAKLKRQLKSSWFKTAAKFMASKALIWGVAAYNTTEVALIIYDAVNAPESYAETGWQTSAGWYGDLFAEKVDQMTKMQVFLNIPVTGTAYYETGSVAVTDSILSHQGPVVSVDIENIDKTTRELLNVRYTRIDGSSPYRNISLVFPKIKFTGFRDRTKNFAFNENTMEFVWGAPQSTLLTISSWVHDRELPSLSTYADLIYFQLDSVAWGNVTAGSGYHAGVVLTP